MIQIRILSPDDAPAYWAVRLEALETVPRAFSASVENHHELGVAGIASRLRSVENGSFVLGAFVDGALVGTVGLQRVESGKTRHSGFVWGVFVSDRARGQGVASTLFEALIERASGYEDLERLTLDVDSENATAMALYRKFGFESFGLEPHALKIGNEYVHLHHMARPLR